MAIATGNIRPPQWCPGFQRDHPIAQGMLSCWPLWERGIYGTVRDIVGGDIGTITNGPIPISNSEMGPHHYFDYVVPRPYIDLANGANLGSRTTWTLNAWFTHDAVGSTDRTLYMEQGVGNDDYVWLYRLGWLNHLQCFISINWVSFTLISTSDVSSGWHMVTVTKRAANDFAIYIDGISEDTDATALGTDNTTTTVHIGAGGGADREWHGGILLVQTWQRALHVNEITDLYADPWAMFRSPRALDRLPLYVGANSVAAPPAGNPYWYYEQMRKAQ